MSRNGVPLRRELGTPRCLRRERSGEDDQGTLGLLHPSSETLVSMSTVSIGPDRSSLLWVPGDSTPFRCSFRTRVLVGTG